MHNPEAVVTIKREKRKVRTRRATPDERCRLWPLLTTMFHGYDDYSKKTKREIPVVLLEPST